MSPDAKETLAFLVVMVIGLPVGMGLAAGVLVLCIALAEALCGCI